MESVEIPLVDLPVGFRFRPTDEELVNQYLKLKTLGNRIVEQIIPEVDVHQLPPWDLPGKINELSRIKSDGDEWFFFSHLQNKYPQSKRARRTNDYGSWKPTGKTHKIRTQDKRNTLGLKKILVFKKRQSPKNAHTKWVLHEYSILNDQSDFVLYRLKKNPDKKGKKNSKTEKTNTGISIIPQEGSRSSPIMSDEINNTSIPIMPQEGSRSSPNMSDEINNTSIPIMPQEGSTSSHNMSDEINNTSIPIMPQEGSTSSRNTPNEVNNTSCSNTLVIAKSIVPEEIPKESLKENVQQPLVPILSPEWNSSQCDFSATPQPLTVTGEQSTPDPVYQDLESYFADTELLQEILKMLTP
ncbi:hypothetical protein BT93_A0140 [Corymbia citriodora subsp. variegata]|nr:hypothetical protein BT93_A0140 [Corymbia citriodora subsp. variegata]